MSEYDSSDYLNTLYCGLAGPGGMSNWPCKQCSFLNHPLLSVCEICDTPSIQSTQQSLNYTGSSDNGIAKQQANTLDHDYDLERVLKMPRISSNTYPIPPAASLPQSTEESPVKGLLELILRQDAKDRLYYQICSPPCDHYSQKGAFGAKWSCGYRNIQMLCSSLMQIEEYKGALFEKNGQIPDIKSIQRWIELAWAAGFDREVCIVDFK